MYPSRPSKKTLVIMLIIGFLGSAFLTIWKSDIKSAMAYFSQGNADTYNLSNLTAGELALSVSEASVQASVIEVRVSTGTNDAEERVTDGFMYLNSSDLELINDPGVMKADQHVGMRFNSVNIPKGATITQAYIQFQVDETSSEATSLVFHGQAADNAAVFTTSAYNISSRAKTNAGVSWNNIPAWNTVGAKVQSPDLTGVIQEIVNRTGWVSGNSLAIIVDGSGRRVASAYESGALTAAMLHIAYLPPGSTATPPPPSPTPPATTPTRTPTATILPPTSISTPTATSLPPTPTRTPTATTLPPTSISTPTATSLPPTQTRTPTTTTLPPTPTNTPVATGQPSVFEVRISAGTNDAEQRVTDGFMYLNSSDLELIYDPGVTKANQSVGMRFTGVSIPKGAAIIQAYIQFQVDETSSEATSLVFHGQAADNAAVFTTSAYNISSRAKTNAGVSWNNIPAWNTVGAKVQSPDLTGVIQEIVNRTGWVSGNSLAIIVDGLGRRVASAYESGALTAALLHVVYAPAGGTVTPPTSTPPGTTPTRTPTATTLPPTPTRTPTGTTMPPTPTRTPTSTAGPTSTPNPQPTPVGQSGNWTMSFDDEFNSGSLDTSKWRTCFWWADTTCSIETNHELELYNPQDVLVQNGLLRLRAQHRDMVAWNGVTYHYTSGMVMSGGRSGQTPAEFTFTYGYAEALVKVPAGQGLWPAFWMLPVSYNTRPEIDIMEILGNTTSQYLMNYHYVGGDAGSTWNGPDFSAGWHVIGLDWEPNAIIWYVDGVERWRYTDQAHISNEASYLLLNLAVGGDWPGPPNGTTPFPSYYEIDYVRVWHR